MSDLVQISMSVPKTLTNVPRTVITVSVPTLAAAMLDIFLLMDAAVMVKISVYYIIASVDFFFSISYHVDIDECALDTDQCAQNCHNTVGSYTCSCNVGYRLNIDRRRCDGTYIK